MDLKTLLARGGLTLAGLMTIVEIAPVKVNPWKLLWKLLRAGMKLVGKAFNADLSEQVTDMRVELEGVKADVVGVRDKVDRVQDAAEERAAVAARTRILRFGDEVLHGVRHTKDHFDSILRDAQDYRDYCDTHEHFRNGVTEPTIRRIEEVYQKCLETNDFL